MTAFFKNSVKPSCVISERKNIFPINLIVHAKFRFLLTNPLLTQYPHDSLLNRDVTAWRYARRVLVLHQNATLPVLYCQRAWAQSFRTLSIPLQNRVSHDKWSTILRDQDR